MNPEIYNESDINTVTKLTANKTWKKDLIKIQSIKNKQYNILSIWENQFIKTPNTTVIKRRINIHDWFFFLGL